MMLAYYIYFSWLHFCYEEVWKLLNNCIKCWCPNSNFIIILEKSHCAINVGFWEKSLLFLFSIDIHVLVVNLDSKFVHIHNLFFSSERLTCKYWVHYEVINCICSAKYWCPNSTLLLTRVLHISSTCPICLFRTSPDSRGWGNFD